jgi:hypothetical protein
VCSSDLVLEAPAQTVVQGEAFGYVRINITAGTGTTKTSSLVSIPLLEDASITGNSAGRITGVTATSLTASGAGWAPGQLSTVAAPYLIEITSGAAQGRMLLIASSAPNTTDTVTIPNDEATRVGDLRNLGINTSSDTYRIRPVDTLSSFFGTPGSTGVLGGASAAVADTIVMVNNGSVATFFYKTDAVPPRWARAVFGSPEASHTPILPYSGLRYERRAATPLQLFVTGKVPTGQRKVSIKASGITMFSPFWPVSQTLNELAIQTTPNWGFGGSASSADTLVVSSAGSMLTYFHDGSNWRRAAFGSPLSGTAVVPVGAAIQINRNKSFSNMICTHFQLYNSIFISKISPRRLIQPIDHSSHTFCSYIRPNP